MNKVAFYTLGCKVNQADTASMEKLFITAGYKIVDFEASADAYIINTCVVTNMGQKKSRQIINRAIRQNPNAIVAVTGCYPQTAPQEVKAIDGVDLIVGTQDRKQIVGLVAAKLAEKTGTIVDTVHDLENGMLFENMPAGDVTDKTRAFLKIQEGCNQYCTYCIIPYARGPLRSRSLSDVATETQRLTAAGFKEIVLIGIHLGCYGKETQGAMTLYDAVKTVLANPNVQRVRLGSLESVEADARLLELMQADKRLCRHLHLPLQSGCDSVLKRMGRPYSTAKFADVLTAVRRAVPDICITTDMIVGFPGETEAEFLEGLGFAESCRFAKIHIFPFSARKGTPAYTFAGAIPEKLKHERCARLAELDQESRMKIMRENIGRTAEVLFEQPTADGKIEGLSGNYLRVFVDGELPLGGQILPVKLTACDEIGMHGTIIK